jgi:hypothetical protein
MSDTPIEALVGLEASQTSERVAERCCPIVELRQYTLKPGRRDDLIALFEEHFIEGQEQYGMQIIGQFRNRVNPDQFIWLRGFTDMETRRQALEGFYHGPIWQEHRRAANDTMIDSDNVLLLKPAHDTSSFHVNSADRPALNALEMAEGGIIIATVYAFDVPVPAQFVEFFEQDVAPVQCEAGATLLGQFVTEPGENTFPVLPVREGEHVFVWLASFADEAAYAAYQAALTKNQVWLTSLVPALRVWLSTSEEVLELVPARRSLLRHRSP